MPKQMHEFFDPRTCEGYQWQHPEGYPGGIAEMIVTKDEETGAFTRFLKFDPGFVGEGTLTHKAWEEVYIIEGPLFCGGKEFVTGTVAVRPPGMPHGPFSAPHGALTYEVHYYSK